MQESQCFDAEGINCPLSEKPQAKFAAQRSHPEAGAWIQAPSSLGFPFVSRWVNHGLNRIFFCCFAFLRWQLVATNSAKQPSQPKPPTEPKLAKPRTVPSHPVGSIRHVCHFREQRRLFFFFFVRGRGEGETWSLVKPVAKV